MKIEKLPTSAPFGVQDDWRSKINELVDAVNAVQKKREAERLEIQEWIGILETVRKSVDTHEKQIDELQNHIADASKKVATMTNSNQKERFQTKIAMLEQNNQVLRNKREEYLGNLEHTRKALDVALKGLDDIIDSGDDGYWTAIKTEEQITAILENKR